MFRSSEFARIGVLPREWNDDLSVVQERVHWLSNTAFCHMLLRPRLLYFIYPLRSGTAELAGRLLTQQDGAARALAWLAVGMTRVELSYNNKGKP